MHRVYCKAQSTNYRFPCCVCPRLSAVWNQTISRHTIDHTPTAQQRWKHRSYVKSMVRLGIQNINSMSCLLMVKCHWAPDRLQAQHWPYSTYAAQAIPQMSAHGWIQFLHQTSAGTVLTYSRYAANLQHRISATGWLLFMRCVSFTFVRLLPTWTSTEIFYSFWAKHFSDCDSIIRPIKSKLRFLKVCQILKRTWHFQTDWILWDLNCSDCTHFVSDAGSTCSCC